MSGSSEIKWYVVHTYSGYENKVKINLEKTIENNGLQDKIVEVSIPVEEAIEIKNNKRRVVQHKLLPGYVLVKMLMTEDTWYIVRNTRGVTGFVGAGNKPTPLADTDFAALIDSVPKARIDIAVGDEVQILAGAFAGFNGKVALIDLDHQKITVKVEMFKKLTDVELDYDEVVRAD